MNLPLGKGLGWTELKKEWTIDDIKPVSSEGLWTDSGPSSSGGVIPAGQFRVLTHGRRKSSKFTAPRTSLILVPILARSKQATVF